MGKTVKSQQAAALQRIKNDPECDLCRNHGLREKSRGHKFNCPFRSCPCHECCWSKLRRIVNRNQQQRRRQHEQMIKRRNETGEPIDMMGGSALIPHPTPEDELTPLSYVFLKFCDGNPRAAMLKIMDVYRDLTRYESPQGSQSDDPADLDAITPSPNNGRNNGWPMPLSSIGAYSYPNTGYDGGIPAGNNCCSPICISPNDVGEQVTHSTGRMGCPNVNVADMQKMEVPPAGLNGRDRSGPGSGHMLFGNNVAPQNVMQNRPDRNTMSFMSMNSNPSMMHAANQFRHHNHRPSYGAMTVGRYGYLEGAGPAHGILPSYNANCQHPARHQMAHPSSDMPIVPTPNIKMSASLPKSDREAEESGGPDQNNLQVD